MKEKKTTGDDDMLVDVLKKIREGLKSLTKTTNDTTGRWPEDLLDVSMTSLEMKRKRGSAETPVLKVSFTTQQGQLQEYRIEK